MKEDQKRFGSKTPTKGDSSHKGVKPDPITRAFNYGDKTRQQLNIPLPRIGESDEDDDENEGCRPLSYDDNDDPFAESIQTQGRYMTPLTTTTEPEVYDYQQWLHDEFESEDLRMDVDKSQTGTNVSIPTADVDMQAHDTDSNEDAASDMDVDDNEPKSSPVKIMRKFDRLGLAQGEYELIPHTDGHLYGIVNVGSNKVVVCQVHKSNTPYDMIVQAAKLGTKVAIQENISKKAK